MSTKNNPNLNYDCYAKAEPDEPMFILLGRDPLANLLVALWADARERMGEDPQKIKEALNCAEDMVRWAIDKKGKDATAKAVVAIHASIVQYLQEVGGL